MSDRVSGIKVFINEPHISLKRVPKIILGVEVIWRKISKMDPSSVQVEQALVQSVGFYSLSRFGVLFERRIPISWAAVEFKFLGGQSETTHLSTES